MNKPAKEWSKIEWLNCYALYRATCLYELDNFLDLKDFKIKILNDVSFYQKII